jgi:hypothetical protein
MISTKFNGNVQSIFSKISALPTLSISKTWPADLPLTVNCGNKTSPVETKNFPFSIAVKTDCHPSLNSGSFFNCR